MVVDFSKATRLSTGMGAMADADDGWWSADVRSCTNLMVHSFISRNGHNHLSGETD